MPNTPPATAPTRMLRPNAIDDSPGCHQASKQRRGEDHHGDGRGPHWTGPHEEGDKRDRQNTCGKPRHGGPRPDVLQLILGCHHASKGDRGDARSSDLRRSHADRALAFRFFLAIDQPANALGLVGRKALAVEQRRHQAADRAGKRGVDQLAHDAPQGRFALPGRRSRRCFPRPAPAASPFPPAG